MYRHIFLLLAGWIAVRSVSLKPQPDYIARHQIFDDMTAAVVKFPGMHTI